MHNWNSSPSPPTLRILPVLLRCLHASVGWLFSTASRHRYQWPQRPLLARPEWKSFPHDCYIPIRVVIMSISLQITFPAKATLKHNLKMFTSNRKILSGQKLPRVKIPPPPTPLPPPYPSTLFHLHSTYISIAICCYCGHHCYIVFYILFLF